MMETAVGDETASSVSSDREERVQRFRLWLLAVAHAITDSYGQSLLTPMFPDIAQRLGLTLAQVGGLPMMMGLSASLAQPLLGWISDRKPRWCLVALGPLIAALGIGFVGYTRTYWELALLLLVAGLGTGAFHPQAAALARQAGRGSGLAMSVFTVGGNVGFGIAPLLGGLYVAWFGLQHFYLAALPAVLFSVVLFAVFRAWPGAQQGFRQAGSRGEGGKSQPWALAALTATVVVRSAVQIGMATFLPFLIQQRFPVELHASMRSVSVSAFLLASAFAGPLGGHLSDRFGRKTVITASFVLAPFPLLLGLQTSGMLMVLLLAAGAFILMLPHPGNVVMAQELMPRSAGIAASLITGLAWGVAQILVLPLGSLADATSVPAALFVLCFVPFLGTLLALPLPSDANLRRARLGGEA